MTDPLPLTGTDLEIWRRLDAGQHPAHIAHVGWYRRSWGPRDVRRVITRMWALEMRNFEERRKRES